MSVTRIICFKKAPYHDDDDDYHDDDADYHDDDANLKRKKARAYYFPHHND